MAVSDSVNHPPHQDKRPKTPPPQKKIQMIVGQVFEPKTFEYTFTNTGLFKQLRRLTCLKFYAKINTPIA